MAQSQRSRYLETVEFMFSQLPMYHRLGVKAYKKDVNNVLVLMEFLGHPHRKFRSVHVAGTNGKGSTSHMLSAIFQAQGLKTGLFISPHYRDFRERIKLNGALVEKAFVIDFIDRIKPVLDDIQPSFFEITAAMAFDYFAQQHVDIAVVEVGLGGRLDSTNVILPELSVITNISYDHMHMLGDTLPLIAAEKAGIIKENVPVVIGETLSETTPVFVEKAKSQHAPIIFADQHFRAEIIDSDFDYTVFDVYHDGKLRYPALRANLGGSYQRLNLQTVLQAVQSLPSDLQPNENELREGLRTLKQRTNFIGRWEFIQHSPRILVDSAHNEGGIREAITRLLQLEYQQLHIVFGAVNDKDISSILSMLPKQATYYFAKANIPRGLDAVELKAQAASFGLAGRHYSSVKNALRAAKRNASPNDLIFVGGSIFVVAEII